MSMTDAIAQGQHSPAAELPTTNPVTALPRSETPIVPPATISGRALSAIVAIMTFLAALTTGAVLLVCAATDAWQSDVAREVTIQIRPATGRDIDEDVARATTIARAFPGVAEVRAYSRELAIGLLEPWLGSGARLEELPVPRLIIVKIAAAAAPNFTQLRQALVEQIPGTSLDDHRAFTQRMQTVARAAVVGGLAVLGLVLVATVLSVAFATRAAMATNRSVIEVLHLIGAKDRFIAGHFQRHFLRVGLQGGLIGGGGAIALFVLAQLVRGSLLGSEQGTEFAALFGSFSIGALGYIAILAQVLLIAFVTAATSRRTVKRTVATIY